jgi:hypothetical protein
VGISPETIAAKSSSPSTDDWGSSPEASPVLTPTAGNSFGFESSLVGVGLDPSSGKPQLEQFQYILIIHQVRIFTSHYFLPENRYYIIEVLSSLAKKSEPLQYAIVSFSTLIYSELIGQSDKMIGFLYYVMALEKFRLWLSDLKSMGGEVAKTAIATSLVFAAFEASHFH